MVRKPMVVWPGLVRMGLHQKSIAGDGNCLFASLSDQMFGDPTRHLEIREKVIDHMRNYRPLFEVYTSRDEHVTQRRTTRSANVVKESEDAYEDYLTTMSRPGSYAGEIELTAFCQVYDQDVTVHLPKIANFYQDSIFYTNEFRTDKDDHPMLHICYGGDELTRAHYDSARNRDGSHPRDTQSPNPEAQARRNSAAPTETSASTGTPSARAIRHSRPDLSTELIHDIMQKSRKDIDSNLDALTRQARSASVSSSQRSSSSKRSREDEGDNIRRKRTDRRKSTRKRTEMSTVSYKDDEDLTRDISPTINTPPSTQDTDSSSDGAEKDLSDNDDGDYRPTANPNDLSDSEAPRTMKRKIIKPSSRAQIIQKSPTQLNHTVKIAERPRSLRA